MRNANILAPRSDLARFCWIVLFGSALFVGTASAQSPPPGETYSAIYRAAVKYLRTIPEEVWTAPEGRGVLLAEALRADLGVVGPRSSSLLAGLELASLDARARRIIALAPLGVDLAGDIGSVLIALAPLGFDLDDIVQQRPNNITLYAPWRLSPIYEVGSVGVRVPIALDNAIAIRALSAVGITGSNPMYGNVVQDALIYLLEFQLANGSWPLVRDGEAGSVPIGDIFVTAEVVRALLPYRDFEFTHPYAVEYADELEIDDDLYVAAAINQATDFLASATYTNAADRAASLLAFLEGAMDPSDPRIDTAFAQLIGMWIPADGSFEHSAFATALAAQTILAATSIPRFEFNTDGIGDTDGPDPDSDEDGACDPNEVGGGCTGTDAFPLDAAEQVDSDGDGLGNNLADDDDDGDGVKDSVLSEVPFAGDPKESGDADADGIADFADPDDDNDGVSDVEEGIAGLNPRDRDTDGDSFFDAAEIDAGTDGANDGEYPPPDGDIFPLNAPDGVTDLRDLLLAVRIVKGEVDPTAEIFFLRHADVAPLEAGQPDPDDEFNTADLLIIVRRVRGLVSW